MDYLCWWPIIKMPLRTIICRASDECARSEDAAHGPLLGRRYARIESKSKRRTAEKRNHFCVLYWIDELLLLLLLLLLGVCMCVRDMRLGYVIMMMGSSRLHTRLVHYGPIVDQCGLVFCGPRRSRSLPLPMSMSIYVSPHSGDVIFSPSIDGSLLLLLLQIQNEKKENRWRPSRFHHPESTIRRKQRMLQRESTYIKAHSQIFSAHMMYSTTTAREREREREIINRPSRNDLA